MAAVMTRADTLSGGRDDAAPADEQVLPGTAQGEHEGAGSGSGAGEQLRQARDKVVDRAKSTMRDARDRAGAGLSDGRRQAADQIQGIGGALRRTSEQLRHEDQAKIADIADSAGRRVDRVADYLRETDGRTMARDVESLARRQPALVFAGAFALGLAAARFLTSSAPEDDSGDTGYGRIRPGGEPAGLGSEVDRARGGFDAPA
jgi:hypothetical protein